MTTDSNHSIDFVYVDGTGDRPFCFGEGSEQRSVAVSNFFIAAIPVTQALWTHIAGNNPSLCQGTRRPVENVSWDHITGAFGFLERIKLSPIRAELAGQTHPVDKLRFRLPSETEWEYAARGGKHWTDGFQFSGGNDIDAVAWYEGNSFDQMHDVAGKAPNQLGLYDMSGNAWEWCQDTYTADVSKIPADGTPATGRSGRRVLRGGCFHNWAIHCTVSKRYEIGRKSHDGCIGFRLVFA